MNIAREVGLGSETLQEVVGQPRYQNIGEEFDGRFESGAEGQPNKLRNFEMVSLEAFLPD